MKRGLMAILLSLSMIVGSLQGAVGVLAAEEVAPEMETQPEVLEEVIQNALQDAAVEAGDTAGESDYDMQQYDAAEIERARQSDVEIEGIDVDVMYLDWGEDEEEDTAVSTSDSSTTSSNQIVLVLDSSGSMSGKPMTELKKACNNFIDDILNSDPSAEIGIVDYNSSVTVHKFGGKNFTNNRSRLRKTINSLTAGGGTAMNAGLVNADYLLRGSTASQKIIIQMADGEPNEGATYYGTDARYTKNEYVDLEGNTFSYPGSHGYHSAIYETFSNIKSKYNIFSLGFFHSMSGTTKQFAGVFMNDIQNQGYTEVTNADYLSFNLEEIAQNINSEHVVLNKSSLVLNKGESAQLNLIFKDSYTSPDRTVTWKSNSEKVAVVDNTGKVTAKGTGNCTIYAEAGGHRASCRVAVGGKIVTGNDTEIIVHCNKNGQSSDKDKYVLADGASITFDGMTYKTNSKGKATISGFDHGEIQVEMSGYTMVSLTPEQLKSNGNEVWLEKEDDNPVINHIWIDGVDVLHKELSMSLVKAEATDITVDVDWRKDKYGKIKLVQKTSSAEFESEKTSISLVLKDKFDISSDLYVQVQDSRGHSVQRKLNLATGNKLFDGVGIEFGEKTTVTLPEDWPLIGGSELEADLTKLNLNNSKINVSIEDGKVKGTIGINLHRYTNDEKEDDPSQRDKENEFIWERFKKAKKKNDPKETKKFLTELKSKYGDAMEGYKLSWGVKAETNVVGYFEGYIDKDFHFQFLDGGLIINPKAEANWHGQGVAPIIPIPWYWEATIKGEIEAKFALAYNEAHKFIPSGAIDMKLGGGIGAGVGIYDVASFGGGGELELNPGFEFYSDSRKTYMEFNVNLKFYIKLKVGFFTKQWDAPPLNLVHVDNSEKAKSSVYSEYLEEVYDEEDYEVQDLGYLEDGTFDMRVSTVSSDDFIFGTNRYDETKPEIVQLEAGTAFAAWIDCSTTDNNDIHVYYSYFDGKTWSDPAIVDGDDTPDFSCSLASDGHKAYIAWQNMNRSVSADDTLSTIASAMDIKVAEYNADTNSFTVSNITDNNGCLDMLPVVSASSEGTAVAYVENADGEWFANDGSNAVKVSRKADGTWSEGKEVAGSLNMVNSMAVNVDEDAAHVAYAVDTDGSLESVDDLEVYLDGKRLTNNDSFDIAPFYVDGTLYFNSNGTIVRYNGSETEKIAENNTIAGDAKLVKKGDDAVMLYKAKDDIAGIIYGVFYDHGSSKWGEAVPLTGKDADITSFDAIWNEDGLQLLCNSVKLTEKGLAGEVGRESYAETTLLLKTVDLKSALSLESLAYDEEDIAENSALPIVLNVKNTGTKTLETIKVEVSDDKDILDTVEFNGNLLPGTEGSLELSYLVRKEDLGKTLTVKCIPVGGKVKEGDNTTGTVELKYTDLAVDKLDWGMIDSENAEIYGTIENKGFSDFGKFTISLRKDKENGEVVGSYAIDGGLKKGEDTNISFQAPYSAGSVYYVTLDHEGEVDDNPGNDYDFVVVNNEEVVAERVLQSINVTKTVTDYNEGDTLKLDDLKVSAVYDDGSAADVTDDAVIDHSKVNMNEDGSYKLIVTYKDKSQEVTINVHRTALVIAAKQKVDISSCFKKEGINAYTIPKAEKKFASVNKRGIVKGKKPGTVSVNGCTKSGKGGEVIESFTVIVEKPSFTQKKLSLNVGETAELGGYLKDITKLKPTSWGSKKENVATVDANGKLTAVSAGTTNITVYFGEGKNAAKLKMKVTVQ
ncbi:MAG: Ig-like domain-containing protein [Lachnospiraceae bacterium]|nr:Ig-like domain-containing protein [Lachnospiraceae bacterium]